MGYGYGIWLIYKKDILKPKHIGHFTICCFMDFLDAFHLYNELICSLGKKTKITIKGEPIIFPTGFYEHDNNNLCAWGYEGENKLWDTYAETCAKYKCDFSSIPHTSIEYSRIDENVFEQKTIPDITLDCTMCLVDITSSNPCGWHIIK